MGLYFHWYSEKYYKHSNKLPALIITFKGERIDYTAIASLQIHGLVQDYNENQLNDNLISTSETI